MSDQQMPWERAGMNAAWYENQPFDVGMRVEIRDSVWRTRAGAMAGRVVGFDASGPLPGENFVRVLVQPDAAVAAIVAIPPAALGPEEGSELRGIALTLLTGAEQAMRPEQFDTLLRWLTGDACKGLMAEPNIRFQRIRAGGLYIPGLVLPELAALAEERLRQPEPSGQAGMRLTPR
ncbi:hypothetical protein K2Z83_07175 [Oscillochloris sp. ZM17-4]|uniref:hypothetical protein n=1 Tax=Oscillochloris sp. ZM17-4 TaxID=2866714 RepID=UPI001C72F32B|nr:hypothetical protein [Oscillochloris sp. ZM17-4]MBX0327458.1 hypothetical protein [Oscillochloris sp. ZM17-4]